MSTTEIILIHKNIAKRQLWVRPFEWLKLNFASCVVHQIRSHDIICFLWSINKPTIWWLILSFTENRTSVFYVLSLWRIYCIKNTTAVWNLTPPPANLALIPQHVIHEASKYNRYTLPGITLCKLLEFLLVLDSMWYTKHRSRYNRTCLLYTSPSPRD